jgi:hypothetical protein
MTDLSPRFLQLDELWTFCGKKQGKLSGKELLNPAMGDDQYPTICPRRDSVPRSALAQIKRPLLSFEAPIP